MKVFYKGIEVDVTHFIDAHPGGPEYLLEYENQEIKQVFEEFQHSEAALEMLKDLQRIDECREKDDIVDMDQPLLPQLLTLSKDQYLQLIHNPQHLDASVRLFKSDLLEMCGRTYWYVVPLVWVPCILFSLYLSPVSIAMSTVLFTCGLVLWTIVEYFLHRFVFHCDLYLPDNKYAILAHYLFHGIHHLHPMDQLRLVMPPILTLVYSSLLTCITAMFLPIDYIFALYSGSIAGYVVYDITHYWLHHSKSQNSYFLSLKSKHLKHHYKNPALGFGITTSYMDWVFNTEIK